MCKKIWDSEYPIGNPVFALASQYREMTIHTHFEIIFNKANYIWKDLVAPEQEATW